MWNDWLRGAFTPRQAPPADPWLTQFGRGRPDAPSPPGVDPALLNVVRDVGANPVLPVGALWCGWCEQAYLDPGPCACCGGRVNACPHTQVGADAVAAPPLPPTALALRVAAAAFQSAILAATPPGAARTDALAQAAAAYATAQAAVPQEGVPWH